MIRKILLALALILIIFLAHSLTKEPKKPVYTDIPTEQEQQQIETQQTAPEAISESDMEQLSPEDAEKDQ